MQQPHRVIALIIALAPASSLAAVAAGCDGCPSSRPYTPYTLGSASGSGAAAQVAPSGEAPPAPEDAGAGVEAAAPAFAAVPGVAPPDGGKRWPLDGGAIAEAPTGRTFDTGLLLDADGDGVRDLVAWARAPDGLRGELWLAPGARPAEARTLAALPGDLGARGCTPRVGLAQIGPATLALDFAPQCAARLRGKTTRWIAVVRLARGVQPRAPAAPEIVLELRLREPPPDEALSAELDASDRDGDGRDDLAVTLALSGALIPFAGAAPAGSATPPGKPGPAPHPKPRVPLVFFDRPAGLSRDPSQPGEALRALAAGLLEGARRKAAAPAVGPAAHALRRLHALVCDDAGRAGGALVATGAGPIRCGEPAFDDAIAHAEGVAASTAGDPLAAVAALEAARGRSKDIARLLGKIAPPAAATVARRVDAAPDAREGWGPLAFEPAGDLLVRTAAGVVRVDRGTFAEAPAGADAWPAALAAAGAELVGVERRCDAPTLLAVVRGAAADAEPRAIPLPLLVDGERCAGPTRVAFSPLGASDRALDLAVGAALISLDLGGAVPLARRAAPPLASPAAPGAARSPDGATIAVRAASGLLVVTAGGQARLWSGEGIEQTLACAPQNGGARVACVSGGAAVIYEAR